MLHDISSASRISCPPINFATPVEEVTSQKVNWNNIHVVTSCKNRLSRIVSCLRATRSHDADLRALNLKLDIRKLANSTSKRTNLEVSVKNYLEVEPQRIPVSEIKEKASVVMGGVEHKYIKDGCHVRARKIINNAEPVFGSANIFRVSIKSENKIEVTNNNFQGVEWNYHVATAALGVDGKVYMFDPAVNNSKPIKLSDWINRFKIEKNLTISLIPKNISEQEKYYVSHEDELSRCMPILRNNESRMNFCDQNLTRDRAVQEGSAAKKHFAIGGYAYPLNPENKSSNMKISFNSFASALLEAYNYSFNSVDMVLTKNSTNQESAVFVRTVEGGVEDLSLKDVERFMQRKGIDRLDILRVPCIIDDPSTYRSIK